MSAADPRDVKVRLDKAPPDSGAFDVLGDVSATIHAQVLQGPRGLVEEAEAALRREAFALGATHVFDVEMSIRTGFWRLRATATGIAARASAR